MTAFTIGFILGAVASLAVEIAWRSGFLAAQWGKIKARWPWLPG
jgi:hypothetical protein